MTHPFPTRRSSVLTTATCAAAGSPWSLWARIRPPASPPTASRKAASSASATPTTPPPSRCCAPRRAPRRCRSATKRWSSRTPSRFPPPTEGLTVHLGMLLQMAAAGAGARIALGPPSGGPTPAGAGRPSPAPPPTASRKAASSASATPTTPPPSRCCAPRRAPRRCRSATKRWSSRTPSRFPPPTEGLTVHLGMLLQMAADGAGERIALGSRSGGLTLAELGLRSQRAGTIFAGRNGERVAMIDLNSEAVPIALFGAALANKAFVPINYRLTDEQLRDLVRRTAPATVIVGEGIAERLGDIEGIELVTRKELLDLVDDAGIELADPYACDPDAIAVLLYTSGTTGEPKAAVLRHRNLASYVISSVEFAGAGEDEAAITSVPPYHIAGISSVLSSTYAGRRVVHLEAFDQIGRAHV